jgi:hypothetical protein
MPQTLHFASGSTTPSIQRKRCLDRPTTGRPLETFIRVADALPVLAREAQMGGQLVQEMGGQLVQGGGEAGDRGRVVALVAGGKRLGAPLGLVDGGLPWWCGDVVEDLPVRGLDLGLGRGGDFGQDVAGPVDQAALAQRGGKGLLGGADEPGGAVTDHQHG